MIELALNKLQKCFGGTMVLEDITFDVKSYEKIGIVGSNGCGKSTLLKIIMGKESYEKGTLSIKKGATLGYLEQIPTYPQNFMAIDVLNTAFEEVDSVYEEMKLLEQQLSGVGEAEMEKRLNKYSKVQALYDSLGGYEKEEKLSKVCIGLKINDNFKMKLFSKLSGGEKTTAILGKILLQNPDILLLDEPSNNLDLDSMEWLEKYLKEYKGMVVVVSHDRYFLDSVVTRIIEIEDMKSKSYYGNYTSFINEKEIQLQLQMDAFMDQQKKIKSIEKTIAELRDWGMRGDNGKFFTRASSMQKMLNKLQRVDKPVMEKKSISIHANTQERSGNDVIIINHLYKRYDEKILFNNANMLVRNSERVALLGVNGSGKSTLIKILLGAVKADGGTAYLGSSIKLGYLPQNINFSDEDKTVLECFRQDVVITEGKARQYLAKYMFFGDAAFVKVKNLSGGEKSRLMLSILMYKEVNFIILDEPTNHLDIDSREELETFLKEFDGTLFFVSHDRYFINNIANRVVELSEGCLTSYDGNYEYYKQKVNHFMKVEEDKKQAKETEIIKAKVVINSKLIEIENNDKYKNSIEKHVVELEERLKLTEKKMNDISDNYEKLNDLYSEKVEIQDTIDVLMAEYFEL